MPNAARRDECSTKKALLRDVQNAMGELMAIHSDEVMALLEGDFVLLEEHRAKLQAVREKKRGLINLYRDHVQAHGC